MRSPRAVLLAAACLLAPGAHVQAADLFVDGLFGADANDGLSWASAKASVNAALDSAIVTPEADVITVAAGRYYERIVMPPDVTLIGSVPSGGGAQDLDAHPSILDGDFRGRVVQFGPGTSASTLDGFVVTHGLWSEPMRSTGGAGINIVDAGPSILRCRIEGNRGDYSPGVVALTTIGSSPLLRIEDCLIRNNVVTGPWNNPAVAIGYHITSPTPMPTLLRNCVIEDNVGGDGLSAGGLFAYASRERLTFENLIVRRNAGDGAYIQTPKGATLTNCEVSANEAGGLFLALRTDGRFSTPPVEHFLFGCTFQSAAGAALGGTPRIDMDRSIVEIRRCVIDGDGTEIVTTAPGEGPGGLTLGGYSTTFSAILNNLIRNCPASLLPTNIDADPLFATGPLGSCYLSQVAAGQAADSPAVDDGAVTATSVGMDMLFTRTDSVTDMGACDLGVHYGFMPVPAPFVEWLRIMRAATPDALALVTEVLALPWTDAVGTLSDPALPLLYYRVDYPLAAIRVTKDLAGDSVRIAF